MLSIRERCTAAAAPGLNLQRAAAAREGAAAGRAQPSPPPQPPAAAAADGDAGGLAAAIEAAFLQTFQGAAAAPRVLTSFRRLRAGPTHEHYWPGLGVQRCDSYLEGLSAHPFPDPAGGEYPWLQAVEAAFLTILEEFERVTSDPAALAARGSNVWVPAARADAVAYGPDWRTLVLQDRGSWDGANVRLFPRTAKLFMDLQAPTLEVFFARQDPGTGIASHTDDVNFIQTSHLGLQVPAGGECWMQAGELRRSWEPGRVFVCDTSFMHETWNGTPGVRTVLIMRHWHPGVARVEQIAAQFLFDCIDRQGVGVARKVATKRLRAAGLLTPAPAPPPAPAAAGARAGGGAAKGGGGAAKGGGKRKRK